MKYDNVRIGMNSRLDTMQAAILQVKLKAFAEYEVNDVNDIAAVYDDALKDTGLVLPKIEPGFRSSWAQYTVQVSSGIDRQDLQDKLKAQGIPTMVYLSLIHISLTISSAHSRRSERSKGPFSISKPRMRETRVLHDSRLPHDKHARQSRSAHSIEGVLLAC